MTTVLDPPRSLAHLKYIVVRYHRSVDQYEMFEPSKTQSYNLGDLRSARKYFDSIGLSQLGVRATDAAFSFGASQAIIKEQRAYGLDLCRLNLDTFTVYQKDIDENRRMLDEAEDAEPDFINAAY